MEFHTLLRELFEKGRHYYTNYLKDNYYSFKNFNSSIN